MPELCSVEFVDIYMALNCHTQTGCSVVMNAASRKHMTVFRFSNFNRFGVVAVNGGQWIEFYLTISSCNRRVLVLFRNSILHSSILIRAANNPQKVARQHNLSWKSRLMCETLQQEKSAYAKEGYQSLRRPVIAY